MKILLTEEKSQQSAVAAPDEDSLIELPRQQRAEETATDGVGEEAAMAASKKRPRQAARDGLRKAAQDGPRKRPRTGRDGGVEDGPRRRQSRGTAMGGAADEP